MYVKIWAASLDFRSDFEICCPREVGMDASLHAYLGCAGLPRLDRTIADLLEREGVRVGVGAALGERAEPAAGVADVGEVDVAGDDVRDVVADDLAAQRVGDPGQRLQVGAVRGQQGDGLGVGDGGRVAFGLAKGGGGLAGREHGGSGSGWSGSGWGAWSGGGGTQHGPFGYLIPVAVDLGEIIAPVMGAAGGVDAHVQVGTADLGQAAVGLLPGQAAGPGAVGGQAGGRVGQRGYVRDQARVEPGLAQVGRVDGQALAQGEACRRGAGGEFVDGGPGAFGVDVVGSQRGDAAPVVDAGPQDQVVLVADQVRRGLDPGLGPKEQPGDGDGGGQVVELGVGHVAHLGVRLGPEVLHDDFLDALV